MTLLITRRQFTLAAPLLLAAPNAFAKAPHPATQPMDRLALPWWRERFAAKQAEIKSGQFDVAFYGDSILQYLEHAAPPDYLDFVPVWTQFYGHRRAINLGFKGDATSHLLWRIENGETTGIAPRAAVVLIGANNFGHLHWPAEPSFEGVTVIIEALKSRLPRTKILLLAVLPSIRNPWVDAQTTAINAMLAARYGTGADPRVTYRDLAPIFMANGQVNREAFLDIHLTPPDPPLHPSVASAHAMLAAIEPWMRKVLG